MSGDPDREIQLGFIAGLHGIKGWVKVHSFTDPRENVVAYGHWILHQDGHSRRVAVSDGRAHGKTVIAKLVGIDDREAAAGLIGAELFVLRSELPDCRPGEFYWADLEGMRVRDRNGNELGCIARMIATGAHDVIVLDGDGERLIPFVRGEVVESVDTEQRVVTVSWDASFWDE